MRYEIRGLDSAGMWFCIFDHTIKKVVTLNEAPRAKQARYGSEQECEKKLMQLLAEGGRPTKGAK